MGVLVHGGKGVLCVRGVFGIRNLVLTEVSPSSFPNRDSPGVSSSSRGLPSFSASSELLGTGSLALEFEQPVAVATAAAPDPARKPAGKDECEGMASKGGFLLGIQCQGGMGVLGPLRGQDSVFILQTHQPNSQKRSREGIHKRMNDGVGKGVLRTAKIREVTKFGQTPDSRNGAQVTECEVIATLHGQQGFRTGNSFINGNDIPCHGCRVIQCTSQNEGGHIVLGQALVTEQSVARGGHGNSCPHPRISAIDGFGPQLSDERAVEVAWVGCTLVEEILWDNRIGPTHHHGCVSPKRVSCDRNLVLHDSSLHPLRVCGFRIQDSVDHSRDIRRALECDQRGLVPVIIQSGIELVVGRGHDVPHLCEMLREEIRLLLDPLVAVGETRSGQGPPGAIGASLKAFPSRKVRYLKGVRPSVSLAETGYQTIQFKIRPLGVDGLFHDGHTRYIGPAVRPVLTHRFVRRVGLLRVSFPIEFLLRFISGIRFIGLLRVLGGIGFLLFRG